MVRKIFGSKKIDHDLKKAALVKLNEIDSSDKFGLTSTFCDATIPSLENKKDVWANLFESEEKVSLYKITESCAGFKQISQRELVQEFAEDFFNRIEKIVNTKNPSVSKVYYIYLQPNIEANEKSINRFTSFQKELEGKIERGEQGDGTARLIKWVKDTLNDLNEKKIARALSQEYLANAAKL